MASSADGDRYRPLTLLHSNDLHGDFLASERDGRLVGGVSRLSGYVHRERAQNPNTIFCVPGDMLQGSLIDTDYKGLSTIELMNMLRPDVACLGNHEFDYGLTHLLFLERCAKFPIISANLYINNPRTRLFKPHAFLKRNGMRIMFIGLITEDALSTIKSDALISTLITVEEAAKEVGRICNAYRNTDVDLTVLLTHIGIEEDKKLAALLDPEWGVDIIVGAHSHSYLEKPEVVNDIVIVQAGHGTGHIGRFDMIVDTDNNDIESYEWSLVPLTDETCPRDDALEAVINSYQTETDQKYGRVLFRLPRAFTHPDRYQETELGNLFADAFHTCLGTDIVLYGSGSIRREETGPIITLGKLLEVVPYHGKVHQMTISGVQLKSIWRHILREEAFDGDHTEFFQLSKGLEITWSRTKGDFERFTFNAKPVGDYDVFTVAIQKYHYDNFDTSFGVPIEHVLANRADIVISTDEQEVLIEFFTDNKPEIAGVDGRLTVLP